MIIDTLTLNPDQRRLVKAGEFVRICRGWAASPDDLDSPAVRALRAGGRLTCLSGLAYYGVWVPPRHRLHVARLPGRPHRPTGFDWHTSRHHGWQGSGPVQSVIECLDEAARHHDAETATIVLDSALNLGLVSEADVAGVLTRAPYRSARLLTHIDGRSMAGTETRVRLLFQWRNVPVTPQFMIEGLGYADLKVGTSLLIECDSEAHHTSARAHETDRDRDLIANRLGYRVVRLTYHQIMNDWPATAAALLDLIAKGYHRREVGEGRADRPLRGAAAVEWPA